MYQVNLVDEARLTAAVLPADARKVLDEFIGLLELMPDIGDLYRPPDSDLRTAALADGFLLVIWLVLDNPDRVEVVRIMWLGSLL